MILKYFENPKTDINSSQNHSKIEPNPVIYNLEPILLLHYYKWYLGQCGTTDENLLSERKCQVLKKDVKKKTWNSVSKPGTSILCSSNIHKKCNLYFLCWIMCSKKKQQHLKREHKTPTCLARVHKFSGESTSERRGNLFSGLDFGFH